MYQYILHGSDDNVPYNTIGSAGFSDFVHRPVF
jgi:hypothetical protein